MVTHFYQKNEKKRGRGETEREKKTEEEKKPFTCFFLLKACFLLDQYIGRLGFVIYRSIYINVKEEKLHAPSIFSLSTLKIYANNNMNRTSIVLSCHLFTHSFFFLLFFLLNKKKKKGKSRITTDDVRRRPSSWSFAFCPSTKRKKRNCWCCHSYFYS